MGHYFFILLFAAVIGFIFGDYIIVKKAKKYHSIGVKKGWHVHHSTYGIIPFLIIPFTINNTCKISCYSLR